MSAPGGLTYNSYLILKEKLYRLNKLESHILGKSANVVVRLNRLLALCLLYTLKNIGINCSLREEGNTLKL